jgi:shikimate kinase
MGNIYLIGMPGSGKTATGKLLAKELAKKFSDTDKIIVERTERSVSTIFATLGEDYFRDLETEALLQVAGGRDQVVATGGGIVLKEHNWEIMQRSGKAVYLKTSPEWILKRTEKSSERPLLSGATVEEKKKQIEELLTKRSSLYEKADFVCVTDGQSPQQVVFEIKQQLNSKGEI